MQAFTLSFSHMLFTWVSPLAHPISSFHHGLSLLPIGNGMQLTVKVEGEVWQNRRKFLVCYFLTLAPWRESRFGISHMTFPIPAFSLFYFDRAAILPLRPLLRRNTSAPRLSWLFYCVIPNWFNVQQGRRRLSLVCRPFTPPFAGTD